MKKAVNISIRGLQLDQQNGQDEIETILSGEYFEKNGNHYLIYEEIQEGTKNPTKNVLKFSQNRLHMSKSGEVNVQMEFEKDRKSVTTYHTPFGNLLLGIDTTSIELKQLEEELALEVCYGLEVNSEFLAECRISIKATNR